VLAFILSCYAVSAVVLGSCSSDLTVTDMTDITESAFEFEGAIDDEQTSTGCSDFITAEKGGVARANGVGEFTTEEANSTSNGDWMR